MKRLILLMLVFLVACNPDTGNVNNSDMNDIINEASNNALNEQLNQINHQENLNESSSDETQVNDTQVNESEVDEDSDFEESSESTEELVEETIDYASYQVNELGQIMVIMYHNLAEKPGKYATTPDLFRADLQRLYAEGYRSISMTDLVTGNIDVPLGTTPVVLTFDDSTLSNFYYEDGEIAKDSVVGILDAFYEENPDFGRNAIFYTYSSRPFREEELIKEKLEYLIENGYEIGNHSYTHKDLDTLDATGIQKELGQNEALIDTYLENHDMIHLSLPYGSRPNEDLQPYLFDGEYQDTSYHMISAVNVGWNPIKSPFDSGFNPKSINRITCGDDNCELFFWMDDFKKNPHKRYISDGDADTIVIPESLVSKLIDTDKTIITYEEE